MSQLKKSIVEYCKTGFFACPLFREPGKFAKITGRKNLNTVAFQCNTKQKRQNYGVQNNYIDSNAKIKGSTVSLLLHNNATARRSHVGQAAVLKCGFKEMHHPSHSREQRHQVITTCFQI